MSKLLRSELKDIVKECLIEILAEGIGSNTKNKKQPRQRTNKSLSSNKNKSYLDNIRYNKKSKTVPDEYGAIPLAKENKIKTNITQNATLNEMLADTAESTLREQLSAERRGSQVPAGNMDPASKIVDQNTPESLFGANAANKWSQLAFFDQD